MPTLRSSLKDTQRIHFYDILEIFRYRKKLFVFSLILAAATIYFVQTKKPALFRTTATLIISEEATSSHPRSLSTILKKDNFDDKFFKTQFEVIKSNRILNKTEKYINKKIQIYNENHTKKIKELTAQEIKDLLKLDINENTNVISITITHTNPAIAKLICNTISRIFIKYDYENRYRSEKNTSKKIEKELITLKEELDNSLQKLLDFKIRTPALVVDSKEEAQNILFKRYKIISEKLNRAYTKRIAAEASYNYFKDKDHKTTNIGTRRFEQLRNELLQTKEKKAALMKKLGNTHPDTIKASTRINQIKEKIKSEYSSYITGLKTKYEKAITLENSIRKNLAEVRNEILEDSIQFAKYIKILREAEYNQKIYEIMLRSAKETELAMLMVHPNFKILDRAPFKKAPVNKSKDIQFLILYSLLFAIIIVFAREYLDTSIKNRSFIIKEVDLPVFGTIPDLGPEIDIYFRAMKSGHNTKIKQSNIKAA